MADEIAVELSYPRLPENPTRVRIELIDVRAADDLLIEYDFERDGWVIRQEPVVERGCFLEPAGEPQEVAFVEAWGLESSDDNSEEHSEANDVQLVDDTAHKAYGEIDTAEDWEDALRACVRILARRR